jgi:hypothetical protein
MLPWTKPNGGSKNRHELWLGTVEGFWPFAALDLGAFVEKGRRFQPANNRPIKPPLSQIQGPSQPAIYPLQTCRCLERLSLIYICLFARPFPS